VVQTTRNDDQDIPVSVEVTYIDESQQFRDNIQRARRAGFPVRTLKSNRQENFRVPLVVSASEAMTGAARALYRDAAQKISHEFRTVPNCVRYEPGDIVQLDTKIKSYVVKLISVSLNSDLSMDCSAVTLAVNDDIDATGYAGEIGGYTPPWVETDAIVLTSTGPWDIMEISPSPHSVALIEPVQELSVNMINTPTTVATPTVTVE
jgi:hypothetical protein